MGFPQPGDTNVRGYAWSRLVPAANIYVGAVEAYASIYGTPLAYSGDDPLRFSFTSDVPVSGDVLFDIAQGPYAAYATNLRTL